MVGFHLDDHGDWVAELACGHRQHVRHRPPFQERPWVITEPGRRGRIGQPLDCPLCDGGGEAPCLAHLVCPDCGAVPGEGGAHKPGCPARAD